MILSCEFITFIHINSFFLNKVDYYIHCFAACFLSDLMDNCLLIDLHVSISYLSSPSSTKLQEDFPKSRWGTIDYRIKSGLLNMKGSKLCTICPPADFYNFTAVLDLLLFTAETFCSLNKTCVYPQCLKQVNMELLGFMCPLVGPMDPSCSGTLPCTLSTILYLALYSLMACWSF